jgi:hypothetical protein
MALMIPKSVTEKRKKNKIIPRRYSAESSYVEGSELGNELKGKKFGLIL